jgi:translation initiation factor RLI1
LSVVLFTYDFLLFPLSQDPPDWEEILKYFRGSELQNYFTKVLEDNLKALIKPQYVDHIPRAIKGPQTVSQMLDSKLELDNKQKMCEELELIQVLDREVSQLSGGELQRFAIAMSCIQRADVCVFPLKILPYRLTIELAGTCSMSLRVTWISGRD